MTFDQTIAIAGAELIQALYRNAVAPTINESSTDTQVLVQRRGAQVWVIFPGTDSWQDWRTDLRATKERFGDAGKIHSGFARAQRSVIVRLIEVLAQMQAQEVVVLGHSLGGALALPTALDVIGLSWIQSVSVYTYGQPRVGNGAFGRAYNAALNEVTFRIVNADDPVPYLPPWLLGYRHAGREVFLNEHGGIQIERSVFSQLQTTAATAWQGYATQGVSALASVSAHGIGRYLQKLKEGTIDA